MAALYCRIDLGRRGIQRRASRVGYVDGHIPGAINVPVGDLRKRLNEIPRDREIAAYCRGPYCLLAFEAVAELRKKGRKARRLEDGFPEWKSGGLPVDRA